MRFVIFSRFGLKGKRWYFHLRAKNGKIIAASEGYRNRQDAWDAIMLVQRSAGAPVEER